MGTTFSILQTVLKGTHFFNFYLPASWPAFWGIFEGTASPSIVNHLHLTYFDVNLTGTRDDVGSLSQAERLAELNREPSDFSWKILSL